MNFVENNLFHVGERLNHDIDPLMHALRRAAMSKTFEEEKTKRRLADHAICGILTPDGARAAATSHALIIDDSVILSQAIRSRLEACGFDTFDLTSVEQQAIDAAAQHRPDLIVVGEGIAEGSPLRVADRLTRTYGTPVLVVTTRHSMPKRLPKGYVIDGPYPIAKLGDVLAADCAGGMRPPDQNVRAPGEAVHEAEAQQQAIADNVPDN